MLAGRETALFHRALGGVAFLAFEEQLFTFSTALTTLRTDILGHVNLQTYTRRFFGGRQPLCGIGVTSVMLLTLKPAEYKPRTAESRPGPGPRTKTSTFFMPNSAAI